MNKVWLLVFVSLLSACTPKGDTEVKDEFVPRETVEMEAVDEVYPQKTKDEVSETEDPEEALFAEEDDKIMGDEDKASVELEPMFEDEELEPVADTSQETESDNEAALEEAMTELDTKVPPRKVATMQGDQISIRYFYDYTDPNIGRIENLIAKLGSQFGEEVLWIYRPVGLFGAAGYAAKASECGVMQGAWPDFHDALVTLEGAVTERNVTQLVMEYGLDEIRFKSCMENPSIDKRLEQYQAEADSLNLESIPSFVIGEDLVLSGNYPPMVFEQMIQSLLQSRPQK